MTYLTAHHAVDGLDTKVGHNEYERHSRFTRNEEGRT